MMPTEFFRLRPRDVIIFVQQNSKRTDYEQEISLSTWRLIRWIGCLFHSANSKKKLKPHQLYPLPLDEELRPAPLTEADFMLDRRKMDKAAKSYGKSN